jgi:hypothetical protein
MSAYYNILNIRGDRMKRSPMTVISLRGASEKGQSKAKKEQNRTVIIEIVPD